MDKRQKQQNVRNKCDKFYMELGERIWQLRNKAGWTQEEMAEKIDMSTQTVYRYENGITEMPAHILSKYSEIFHVSIDFIIKGKNAEVVSMEQVDNSIEDLRKSFYKKLTT